jgi:uroporphyrinogen decarboxylase
MLFDTWAGILSPMQFRRHVIAPMQAIMSCLRQEHPAIPIIGFPRLAGLLAGTYAAMTQVDAIGLDTSADLALAAATIRPGVALQGNLDPLALVAGGEALKHEAASVLAGLKGRPAVFNLGHGVMPQTLPEHVAVLVEQVRAA